MRLRLIGLDYKSAPVALREEFSFSREEVTRFLRQWIEVFPDFEAVLLSTCNRTELYVGSENDALPDLNDVLQLIDHLKRKEDSTLESASEKGKIPPFLHVKDDADAVAHLFAVAASLESMVLGEPQILAQIKDAYRMAAEEGATGKMIHSAFQSALKAAKRVAVETEIFRHRISIPAIAISDFALGIFEKLSDKRTLSSARAKWRRKRSFT